MTRHNVKTSKRHLAAAGLAVAAILSTAGCGDGRGIFGEIHDISVEVTGAGGTAGDVTYQGPGRGEPERNVPLPWRKTSESEFVPVMVRATPTAGQVLSCRIVVDGQEVATATGQPGAPVECRKDSLG